LSALFCSASTLFAREILPQLYLRGFWVSTGPYWRFLNVKKSSSTGSTRFFEKNFKLPEFFENNSTRIFGKQFKLNQINSNLKNLDFQNSKKSINKN